MKNVSFYLLFIYFFYCNYALSESFTVVGHTQYLLSHPKKYDTFIKLFNNDKSNNIFFLGDSGLERPDIFNGLDEKVKKKIYSVAGNGEHKKDIDSYIKRAGYLNHDFETNNFIFLLLDSSQSLIDTQNLLKNWKRKYTKKKKIVILLTHHRIWDDSVLSAKPYRHDKSYYFREIYPLMLNFVDYIIAGNSKRQYFQDLPESLKNKKVPNYTTTYWEESLGSNSNIKAYNVGMGNGLPYATFVTFELFNGKIIPHSTTVKLSEDGLDEYGLVNIKKFSPIIRDVDDAVVNFYNKILMLAKIYKDFIYGFSIGIIFVFFIYFFKKKYFRL